jgi:CRISP-associated protein Cas1
MSFHILHVFHHGAVLGKERGFITCTVGGTVVGRLPHEDLRAVIIAARGVTLTSNFVSAVLDTNGIILHCDESYQPCGITAPLARVVDTRAYLHQIARPKPLNTRLWNRLLRGKTLNQSRVLQRLKKPSPHLELALRSGDIHEGNCARRYWQLFFPSIGWLGTSRDRKENTAPNQMLNYGYTVLGALCHRSLLVHGLTPALGVFHGTRYRSLPLVYDLMEPFRPMVDMMLAEFMRDPDFSMKAWAKKVGTELRETRTAHERYSLKLMDAIDVSASSMARCYATQSVEPFWVPEVAA